MLFHVTCFYVYNIYCTRNVQFLRKYYMCTLCESIVIYQCTCVFVNDYGISYCNILYQYDIHIFGCFNINLSCVIVWNADTIYHIYHFNYKSQYLVQL